MPTRTFTIARFAILLPLVALGECPLDSPVPIAEASSAAFDRELIGAWRCLPQDDDAIGTITISQATPTKLFARFEAPGEKPDSVWLHSAKSGKTKLVNVEEYEAGDGNRWSLFEMVLLRPQVLQVRVAMGELAESDTGSALRKVVAGIVKADRFDMGLICLRTPPKEKS